MSTKNNKQRSFYAKVFWCMNDAFDYYFADRTDLKHSSLLNYNYLYDRYVRPSFGCEKLTSLSYSDFRIYYLSLAQEYQLSKKTLLLLHSIINQIMKSAVRDNILRTNPAEGIIQDLSRKYGWQEKKRHALTPEQQTIFINHAMNEPEFKTLAPLLIVLLGTGLRIGEALGLCWEQDVDFISKTITVSHSLQYRKLPSGKTGFYISTPKTASGRRTVPMIPPVEAALYEEKRRQDAIMNTLEDYVKPEIDGYKNFVFTNNCGELYHANTINRYIKRIIKSYNTLENRRAQQEKQPAVLLPDISCHHLRHTFCSRLCENETNLKVIQDIMGHASITTTMNRYAEITEQKKTESLNLLAHKLVLF